MWGVESSPQNAQLPPHLTIMLSLQYKSNYIGKKSSRRDEVSAHEVRIPCLKPQLCLKLKMHQIASQRMFISKTFRGDMPQDSPLEARATRDFSPRQ